MTTENKADRPYIKTAAAYVDATLAASGFVLQSAVKGFGPEESLPVLAKSISIGLYTTVGRTGALAVLQECMDNIAAKPEKVDRGATFSDGFDLKPPGVDTARPADTAAPAPHGEGDGLGIWINGVQLKPGHPAYAAARAALDDAFPPVGPTIVHLQREGHLPATEPLASRAQAAGRATRAPVNPDCESNPACVCAVCISSLRG